MIGGHDDPRRLRLVGAGQHVLDGVLVLRTLVTVAPVLIREFPPAQVVFGSGLEPAKLLLRAAVHPELDQDHAFGCQRPLEVENLAVGT